MNSEIVQTKPKVLELSVGSVYKNIEGEFYLMLCDSVEEAGEKYVVVNIATGMFIPLNSKGEVEEFLLDSYVLVPDAKTVIEGDPVYGLCAKKVEGRWV